MAAKAVGYVRVSTQDQAREGWGLKDQRARIKAYCESRGWRLARVYADEGLSGKNGAKRPGFERMAKDVLGDGIAHIVALKLDRLGRSAVQLLTLYERLERKGVSIVCIEDSIDTSTAGGRLLRTVLAAVAEFERDVISQRTKNGLAAARNAGRRLGAPPYGSLPGEKEVAKRIRREQRQGLSLKAIADQLNREGVRPRRGARWHATTIARVLGKTYARPARSQ